MSEPMICDFTLGRLEYFIRYPRNFREDEKYPVILFLHGAGSRGDDLAVVKRNPYFIYTKEHEPFPFITVAPQCRENCTWYDFLDELKELVYMAEKLPYADPSRIYLMGSSMGGYGTWQLAMSIPEHFAAIVPVCSGGMYWNAGRLVNVPVWAFHGGKDTVVYPEESQKMVDSVNRRGGNAKLTIYPENTHDAWTDTYRNIAVFQWLLSHRNQNTVTQSDGYNNAEKYG